MTEPRFPGYRVLEPLAGGAISTLYKAVQESTGRVVVLKSLKPTIAHDSPFAAQLDREKRTLAALAHPNVVLLVDAGPGVRDGPDRPFIVIEWVEGTSLRALLAKEKCLDPEVACAIACELADALEHVHARGFVHKDVKPDNVLLARGGEVKLIDFGIATRARAKEATAILPVDERGALAMAEGFGTPAYMSPEQILGDELDGRSDLFSLGVLLYEMLTGQLPFDARPGKDGGRERGRVVRLQRDTLVPLRERAHDVPRALEHVVHRMLERTPRDRIQRVEDAAADLAGFVSARTTTERRRVVRRALHDAGLVKDTRRAATKSRPAARAWIRPEIKTALGFLGIGAAAVALFAWNERGLPQRSDRASAAAAGLPLAPRSPGFLRVMAAPWAEVWIDGEHVETTPFARAIALPPGTHHVTLRHPRAEAERRAVTVVAGETVTLDVRMGAIADEPADEPAADGGDDVGAGDATPAD